ncbi:hypothetical protein ONZ43_g7667 [Nemania bipapillata]|uniref:Uncharacterized protein n=1 Tax=Nemania bipapillata TaxID=110536 RepID=A0ACC2HQ24_9PEZI|nr:hypothetical protein ONZ43_g7667 [Nemania bipapillata]
MMFTSSFAVGVAVVLSLASIATAHPGEHLSKRQIDDEMGNAHVVNLINSRALEACQNDPEVKARKERAIARRAATFARLRKERNLEDATWLHRRDAASLRQWAALSHDRTKTTSLNRNSTHEEIFGTNTSCVLTPDNANGPYFVSQEHIRSWT